MGNHKRKLRKLKRRIEALEQRLDQHHEPADIPVGAFDILDEWRAMSADYSGYIDDEAGDVWGPGRYL